jgi:hypothetical protein
MYVGLARRQIWNRLANKTGEVFERNPANA